MKIMTCRQMGGPCDTEIHGETAEEMMADGAAHITQTNDEEHKKVLEMLKGMKLENIILVGDEFKELIDDSFTWFKTSLEAKEYLLSHPIIGGTILIKGSNSTKMEIIADAL